MLIHVVDLENYSLIGDWMDFQHPAVTAMITPSAEELSVYGPRNNKTVYVYMYLFINKKKLKKIMSLV